VSSRRTLILAAAIVLGAVAAFALFTYVRGIEDRAHDRAERVEVFKIVQDIPKGTFGDEAFQAGMIEIAGIPREFRPANAITDPAEIDGLVALSDLASNQVVVSNQFVSQAASLSTFAGLLSDNEVAITVAVDHVRGVAGLLVPGDFVNILVNEAADEVNVPLDENGEPVQTDGGIDPYTAPARFLYQKVQILAVDQERRLEPGETVSEVEEEGAAAAPTGPEAPILVTFAVPAEASQRIASVDDEFLHLTLVPRDYQAEPMGPLDQNEVLPGEAGQQLTPYGPEGRLDS
jgi:Flp pilus assembly protein CpaB